MLQDPAFGNGFGIAEACGVWELHSLEGPNDTYWVTIILLGAEQVDPLVLQVAVIDAAGWWLVRAQGTGCERKGILSERAVFIVILTEVLTVLAVLPDVFPRGMYYIMNRRAVPVLQTAPHIGHKAITVTMETLWVVSPGVVHMKGMKVLHGGLHPDGRHQTWP